MTKAENRRRDYSNPHRDEGAERTLSAWSSSRIEGGLIYQWRAGSYRLALWLSGPETLSIDGAALVMVVKFLPGLDAITPPLAGAEGASRAAFFGYDAVGALLWSSLYAGLRYFFADSLGSVAAFLSRFSSAWCLESAYR